MKDPVNSDHRWPTDQTAHVWGPWFPYSYNKKHRKCVHPECSAVEIKEVKA